jgi:hypothetical protein
MKVASPIALLGWTFCLLTAAAYANSLSRSAVSGQAKRVARYHSWDAYNCKSLAATVNIISKPSHGILIPHIVDTTITTSRYGSVGHCSGTRLKALEIDYKSIPTYHGSDVFVLDVTFGFDQKRDRDTYTITVQ